MDNMKKNDRRQNRQLMERIVQSYEDSLFITNVQNIPYSDEIKTLGDKYELITDILVNQVQNSKDQDKLVNQISKDLNFASLNLSYLILSAETKESIILIPSMDDYMTMTEVLFVDTMEHLSGRSIYNQANNEEMAQRVVNLLDKISISREAEYEYKLLVVLAILISIFNQDRENINFIAKLFLSQYKMMVEN